MLDSNVQVNTDLTWITKHPVMPYNDRFTAGHKQ